MPLTASRPPSQVFFFWQAGCGTRWRPAFYIYPKPLIIGAFDSSANHPRETSP